MKTRVFLAILLLTVVAILYCSDDPSENAEYQRKTRELKALSERFKAETGFEGTIEYDYDNMKLSSFRGGFTDIAFPATQDTTIIRQSFERVVDKMLPYISATRAQLKKSGMFSNMWGIGTRYQQLVNGYPIEDGGYLNVSYTPKQNRTDIMNVTVDIEVNPIEPILTEQNAIQLYYQTVEVPEAEKNTIIYRPKFRLVYMNIAEDNNTIQSDYRLCWNGGGSRILAIDAVTGEVYRNINGISDDLSVSVEGTVYFNSDNTNSTVVDTVSYAKIFTSADCDGLSIIKYTDENGSTEFQGTVVDNIQSCLLNLDNLLVTTANGNDVLPTNMQNTQPGSQHIMFDYASGVGSPSNLFFHAYLFYKKLHTNLGDEEMDILSVPTIISGATLPADSNGETSLGNSQIRISPNNGCYSSTLCHEMTHLFVYNVLQNHTMYPNDTDLQKAMSEAFSSYFPSTYRNSSMYRSFLYTKDLSDVTLTIDNVHNNNLENFSLPLNENFYASYYNRFPIASAWWTLRNNPIFGMPAQTNPFDQLLVFLLVNRVNVNYAERYKPRYFFNLLMKEVATDTQTWTLNDQQVAIKDAYNSRGLHFYPTVESYSSGQKGRNIFGLNDPVNVKISKCPQNTKVNIYVVKHGDYTYTDGAPVSALSSFYPNGFSPNTAATTDANGEWDGQIWVATEEGEYDIIVDIGSPTTPDDTIHFAFSGTNVMDGFDGRTEPGFMVKDRNIDVVMALDVLAANSKVLQSNK